MKLLKYLLVSVGLISLTFCSNNEPKEFVTFYEVPLVCGAAPQIGCGSRIKPLFLDTEKEESIKESWTNRQGTIIAIKWKNDSDIEGKEKLIQSLFKKHDINALTISEEKQTNKLLSSLNNEKDQWLKGMDVDKLSLEEAGVIAQTLTDFALEAELVSKEEHEKIRHDVEEYFKTELVKVRTNAELNSEETQNAWRENGFAIYEKHVGSERAETIASYFAKHEMEIMQQESCCSKDSTKTSYNKEIAQTSEITCPKCGHKKTETMPTEVCQIKYTCEKCKTVLYPKEGDCCVFCTYGTHKCPSKQI